MSRMRGSILTALAFAGTAMAVAMTAPLAAQEGEGKLEIISGDDPARLDVRDIEQFREVAADGSFLPRADALSLEGLLGDYDLALPLRQPCAASLCLTGYAKRASLPQRPQDTHFVGFDLGSGADAAQLPRSPISLVLVADRSGSMAGRRIELEREALLAVLDQLHDDDRVALVSFDKHGRTDMPMAEVGPNRGIIGNAIRALGADGDTHMETGLKLGYDIAAAERAQSGRDTRVMLLTDELPNASAEQPAGFMGMTQAAARQGIGLTLVGMDIRFDNALTMKLANIGGGNAHHIALSDDARELVRSSFVSTISPVARDAVLTVSPAPGSRISALYGVPPSTVSRGADGSVSVRLGSVFLAGDRGELLVGMTGNGAASGQLASATLSYSDALSGASGTDSIALATGAGEPPANLAAAEALVDEFLTLDNALKQYHASGDAGAAADTFGRLQQRLSSGTVPMLAREQAMVSRLAASAHRLQSGGGAIAGDIDQLGIVGQWSIVSQKGLRDLAPGDIVEITPARELVTIRQSGEQAGTRIAQTFQVSANELHIDNTSLVFAYSLDGTKLKLATPGNERNLRLKRIGS